MNATKSILIVAATIGLFPIVSGCATPHQRPSVRTIAVVGQGVVHVKPDRFVLRTGVEYRDKDLSAAHRKVVETSQRIVEIAKQYPIDTQRTVTGRFDVYPQYDYETKEFLGYCVDQDNTIYLNDLSKAEELTLDVLRTGATSVSIDYSTMENTKDILDRARLAALRDAREQARRMAAELGQQLGPPLHIGRPGDEYSGDAQLFQSNNQQQQAWDSDYDGDSVDVTWLKPTEVEFKATIFVRFALADPPGD